MPNRLPRVLTANLSANLSALKKNAEIALMLSRPRITVSNRIIRSSFSSLSSHFPTLSPISPPLVIECLPLFPLPPPRDRALIITLHNQSIQHKINKQRNHRIITNNIRSTRILEVLAPNTEVAIQTDATIIIIVLSIILKLLQLLLEGILTVLLISAPLLLLMTVDRDTRHPAETITDIKAGKTALTTPVNFSNSTIVTTDFRIRTDRMINNTICSRETPTARRREAPPTRGRKVPETIGSLPLRMLRKMPVIRRCITANRRSSNRTRRKTEGAPALFENNNKELKTAEKLEIDIIRGAEKVVSRGKLKCPEVDRRPVRPEVVKLRWRRWLDQWAEAKVRRTEWRPRKRRRRRKRSRC